MILNGKKINKNTKLNKSDLQRRNKMKETNNKPLERAQLKGKQSHTLFGKLINTSDRK